MAKRKTPTIDDKRIKAIPLLISGGYIKTWQDIFEYLPRSVIAYNLGINGQLMKQYVEVPGTMPAEDIDQLAVFLKVEVKVLKKLSKKKPSKRN
jgi:hypothetical protein